MERENGEIIFLSPTPTSNSNSSPYDRERVAGGDLVRRVDRNGDGSIARSGDRGLHLHDIHHEELVALRYLLPVRGGDTQDRARNRSLDLLPARGSRCSRRGLSDTVGNGERDLLAVDDRLAVPLDLDAIGLAADGDRLGARLAGRLGSGLRKTASHRSLRRILEEEDALLLAGGCDEDILISDRKPRVFKHLLRNRTALLRVGVVHLEHRLLGDGRIGLRELARGHELGGLLDDLRIRFDRGLAEVAEDHLRIARRKLLELAEHDVLDRLLRVELRDRRDGSAEAAETDAVVHLRDHVIVLVHHVVVAEHLRVCRQRAARHRAPHDLRVHVHRLRREEVLLHRVLEAVLRLLDLVDVEVETIVGIAVKRVPHRDDVGLAGAAAHRGHREIETVRSAAERREVAGDAVAGRLVRMELNVHLVAEKLAGEHHRVVHGGRRRRAGRILERDAVEGNSRIHNLFQSIAVELRRVRALIVDPGRQTHHRDDDFVVETRVVDALARPLEVVDIVERVEVTDRAHAVLLEHLRVELDHVGALRLETDDVHSAGERLEVGFGSGLAERVHHVERIFLAVEVAALKTRSAACLEPPHAGVVALLHAGEEVFGEDTRADDRLEAVTERGEHELYILFSHLFTP